MKNDHETLNTNNTIQGDLNLKLDQSMKLDKSKITEKRIFISNKLIAHTFHKEFLPLALTTTFFAPVNRIKICLQNMKLMSINESEKVYRPSHLIQSK
jgi:hypothetical protein